MVAKIEKIEIRCKPAAGSHAVVMESPSIGVFLQASKDPEIEKKFPEGSVRVLRL